MPSYLYNCSEHGKFEVYARFKDHVNTYPCPVCGEICHQVITAPTLIIPRDVRYISPTTGHAITSEEARRKDLANSNCYEYDPGMKQDYQRRIAESDKQLDALVDDTIEKEIASMPAIKREALETAAINFDLETVRI